MNVELLRKIAAVIQEKPTEFRMSSWHGICRTTHCIGGWAQVLSGEKESTDSFAMAKLLDIEAIADEVDDSEIDSECEAGRLFFCSWWPKQFLGAYMETDGDKAMAKIAAARIEHFIATGGAE